MYGVSHHATATWWLAYEGCSKSCTGEQQVRHLQEQVYCHLYCGHMTKLDSMVGIPLSLLKHSHSSK